MTSSLRNTKCNRRIFKDTNVQIETDKGIEIITVERESICEYFITAAPQAGDSARQTFIALKDAVNSLGVEVIKMDVFGSDDFYDLCTEVLADIGILSQWPVSWVIGNNCFLSDNIAGAQIYAVKGVDVKSLVVNSRTTGRIFQDSSVKYCHLSDIKALNTAASLNEQATETFERINSSLIAAGMKMTDIVRTWFYNDDILGWYDIFNNVRTKYYNNSKIFDNLLPASTGIGGGNPQKAANQVSLLALNSLDGAQRAREIKSPMQNPAGDYGSSFSRAMEIDAGDLCRLSISGTASIDPEGNTVYLDDVLKQTELTFKVAQAILNSRQMDFSHVVRGIAYFRYAKDATIFQEYCDRFGARKSTFIVSENVVCREDLLFEIELEAVALK